MVAAAVSMVGAIVAEVGTEAVPQVLRGERALQDQGEVGKEDDRPHGAAEQRAGRGAAAGRAGGARAPLGALHARAARSRREADDAARCACVLGSKSDAAAAGPSPSGPAPVRADEGGRPAYGVAPPANSTRTLPCSPPFQSQVHSKENISV